MAWPSRVHTVLLLVEWPGAIHDSNAKQDHLPAVRNPVTKAEACPKVVLPQGFGFKEGEQYALKEF